jgi:hypothetical protein
MREIFMAAAPAVSLVLNLQSVRTDIDLPAFRFFFGLIEIVAPTATTGAPGDEREDIAVGGHPCLHGPRTLAGRY